MTDVYARTALKLAENLSATGSSVTWQGGPGTFSVEATWGGGSVSFQFQTLNGTWVNLSPDAVFTANGAIGFVLQKGAKIRASISTATAVFAYAVPL